MLQLSLSEKQSEVQGAAVGSVEDVLLLCHGAGALLFSTMGSARWAAAVGPAA